MSQATICLDTAEKVQNVSMRIFTEGDAETAPLRPTYLSATAGVVLQVSPVVSDLAAWPHAAGSFGLARTYPPRAGGGCRDGVCGRDGALPGRIGSGVRAGSDSRPRLNSRAGRSVRCR